MKPHFIVCGERSEPTWDSDLDEIKRFDSYAEAADDRNRRCQEKPGEPFFVYQAVGDVAEGNVSVSLYAVDADAASRPSDPGERPQPVKKLAAGG